jgi:pyruvate formate lyase activating enzyme
VSRNGCTHCGKCREVCPHPSGCIACGLCVEVCPLRLRKLCGRTVSAGELAHELLKDRDFLMKNAGGITLSGGEPLSQPQFLFELIPLLKPMHVAVETSGHAPANIFQTAVHLADLVMLDIKHTDPIIHQKYTGDDNRMILDNLKYLCRSDSRFIIRIPVIPGVNDNQENFAKVAQLIKDAKGLKRLELLPYHQTAGAKYAMLGTEYQPPFNTRRPIYLEQEVFQQNGIKSIIL